VLVFDHGQVVAAEAEGEHGDDALAVIVQVLGESEFEYEARRAGSFPEAPAGNLDLSLDGLEARLDELATATPRLPAFDPAAVPYGVPQAPTAPGSHTPLALSRLTLAVFVDVDGRRCIADLAAGHGLRRTLMALARLEEHGLVTCAPPLPGGSGPPRTAQARRDPHAGQPAAPQADRTGSADGDGGRASADVAPGLTQTPARWAWPRPMRVVRELTRAVAVVGVLTLALHSVGGTFRVQGTSMEPTLGDGQLLLVNKGAYFHFSGLVLASSGQTNSETEYPLGGPKRGDLVVFHAPPQPGTDYIKRIIGVPGDEVLISAGQVFVNGEPLDEPYVRSSATPTYTYPVDGRPLHIPLGSYFVLGDNRRESVDSHLGWLVAANDLVGKTWLTLTL
jgi:signal peptidase I